MIKRNKNGITGKKKIYFLFIFMFILVLFISEKCFSQYRNRFFFPEKNTKLQSSLQKPRAITWNIQDHMSDSYFGWSSLVHIGAIGATWFLIESEVDAKVQRWSAKQNRTISIALSAPALLGGVLVPIILPLRMYGRSNDNRIRNGGMAAGQAVLIAFTANIILKAITGRIPPDKEIPEDGFERSRVFRFGFLRGGVFNGWPSGHTMTNMALAAALANYFYDSKRVKIFAYSWATYVMAATTFGIQGGVHWLSDVIAGGLMGWIIGRTIGAGFAGQKSNSNNFSLSVFPVGSNEYHGFQVIFHWR